MNQQQSEFDRKYKWVVLRAFLWAGITVLIGVVAMLVVSRLTPNTWVRAFVMVAAISSLSGVVSQNAPEKRGVLTQLTLKLR